MMDVFTNISLSTSDYLNGLGAQMSFQYGANQQGRAWAGPRGNIYMDI
jgi:hypothetical protein